MSVAHLLKPLKRRRARAPYNPPFAAAHFEGDELHGCCVPTPAPGKAFSIEAARIPTPCAKEYLIIIEKDDWPGNNVMGITYAEFKEQFIRACRDWNAEIGLNLIVTDNMDHFPAAHCKVQFYRFNGNVLADSHLADNTCVDNKRQRYDHRTWTLHLLYLTILHELGHLLGLHHKNGSFIMNPSILTGLRGLTDTDIRRARVSLGYGPATNPKDPDLDGSNPDPTPEPPDEPDPRPPSPPEDKDMDWIELFLKLWPLIQDCIDKDGEAKVYNRLRRGGMAVSIRMWREGRRQGLRGKDLREEVTQAKRELASFTDKDFDDLISEAKAAAAETDEASSDN